jgi:hypothetical protein
MKAIVVLASFASAACIYAFVGRTAPRSQMTATLAYLWNPLVVVEFAGEGHNDAVMIAFVLLGFVAIAARRPAIAGVALLLGVLTKYLPLLFLPPQLAYAWRERRSTARFAASLGMALVVGLGIAVILYAPIWAGADSFKGLLERAEPISSASPFGAINWLLRRSPLRAFAGPLALLLVTAPVCAFVLWRSAKATDAPGLARSCGWIAFLYLLGAAPDYWPWYSCMPVALLLAGYTDGILWLLLFTSLCARVIAPFNVMFVNGLLGMRMAKGFTTGVGATLPIAVAGAWVLFSWPRLRPAPLPGAGGDV